MADRTESSIEIGASPKDVLGVIADFESYPEWTGAVKRVEIVDPGTAGRASKVRFVLDAGAIKDTYVLAYTWNVAGDGVGTVSWTLVESTMLKALDGSYELTGNGASATSVRYTLSVDMRMPMLGMFRRKAEKIIIDTALNELKKRVEG